jgi:hypothetical protein
MIDLGIRLGTRLAFPFRDFEIPVRMYCEFRKEIYPMLRISTVLALCNCLGLVGIACSSTGSEKGSGGSNGSGGTSSSGTTGSGGSSGTAGSVGNGGITSSNSTVGSGGKSGGGTSGSGGKSSGGTSGSGGKTGTGGTVGSGGSGTTGNCITPSSSISSKMATVGIVKWSTTLISPKEAHIDFGLTDTYGMTAPIPNPTASDNTTLLLGMKAIQTYHYRIVVSSEGGNCTSQDYTITTKSLPTGLPTITPSDKNASALYGGFLITGQYMPQTGKPSSGGPAYIFDSDGEIVWTYDMGQPQVTGVRMTYDGTALWINTANVPGPPQTTAKVHRVSMDGMKDEDFSNDFTGLNHQLTVLPDDTVAFYAYGENGCEDIKERSPRGVIRKVVNSGDAQGGASACHLNYLTYSKADDTLVFSDLDNQSITKIKRSDGSTVWTINGPHATLAGEGWKGSQHGIHLLGLDNSNQDHILFFNNNSKVISGGTGSLGGTGDGSSAIEIKLDLAAKKITKVWAFKGSAKYQNDVMGDVQRLPNGNTLIAFSTKGAIEEVDANNNILTDWIFPLGAEFGYVEKRASLYGPPPK